MRTFDYVSADTVSRAIAISPERRSFLAGGTTLLDLMKINVMQPNQVVDINGLPLRKVESLSDGRLRVGALVSNTDLANHPVVQQRYPVLRQAILAGASTQLRNKATTGGNIMQRVRCNYFRDGVSACNKRSDGTGCAAIDGHNRSVHAVLGTSDHCIATHPSDMCVALVAIGASVTVQGPKGTREIPFEAFHLLPGDTPWKEHALAGDELITHLTLDAQAKDAKSAYLKLRDRHSYQFALASAAVMLTVSGNTINTARIALGGVATKPWRANAAEDVLIGKSPSQQLFEAAAAAAFAGAKAYGQNGYKLQLGQQAITRCLRTVLA